MGISVWQLLIVLVIVVLIFGTKRLRSMGGDLGSAFKSFKKAVNDKDGNAPEADDNATQESQQPSNLEQKQGETIDGEVVKEEKTQ